MKNIKIVFVEDEPALAEIVKESLEDKDFEVIHVATDKESQARFAAHQFDILILDFKLPGGMGCDF